MDHLEATGACNKGASIDVVLCMTDAVQDV